MAQNTIEIEVELQGQKNALKGLDQIKEGAEGIGETFKGVGDIVGKTNEQLGESLSAVSDAVGSSVEAFQGMRDAIRDVGAGTASIGTLVGPISLLTVAIGGAYEAYRQFSGAAEMAKDQQEAMAAASSDLTTKLEELAEKGIGYAKNQLLDYVRVNLRAQLMKEMLEKRVERSLKALKAEADATKSATKAAQEYAKVLNDQNASFPERQIALVKMNEALATQQLQTSQTSGVFSRLADEMIKVNDEVDRASKRFKTLEQATDEGLQTKAKENIARLASVKALQAEVQAESEASKLTALRAAEREKSIALSALESLDRQQLRALVNAQEVALKALNEESLKDQKLSLDIAKLTAEKTKARKVEIKAINEQAIAEQALREEQMRLVKESQIRQLDIKLTEEGYAQQIALAQERYQLGLALAQDDALQREIVARQHDLAIKQIEDQRTAREQQAHDRSLEMLMSRIQKEDQLYDAQAQKVVRDQERLVSSFTNFLRDMTKSTGHEIQSSVVALGELVDGFGKQFARAGVEAIMFGKVAGKSMKEATAEILKSLAIEAGVRAVMESAMAIASFAVGDAKGMAGHLAAAATYGTVGAAAATGANLLGVGGAGATGGTTTSPTGAPQVAGQATREQAETAQIIYNVNFGGAVIYDTKEAAKRAMVGDIVRTYNGNNRGMPRFNPAR